MTCSASKRLLIYTRDFLRLWWLAQYLHRTFSVRYLKAVVSLLFLVLSAARRPSSCMVMVRGSLDFKIGNSKFTDVPSTMIS
jgi:hypothetical protein